MAPGAATHTLFGMLLLLCGISIVLAPWSIHMHAPS